MNDSIKAILFCLLFFCCGLLVLNWIGRGADADFHFVKAQGLGSCQAQFSEWQCTSYPPLFSWLASPFAFSLVSFKVFVLFLFGVVTPLVLFLLCKKRFWVLLCFFATNWFYVISAGLFAEGLALLVWLFFWFEFRGIKGWVFRLVLVLISPLIHNWALPLYAITFVLLFIQAIVNSNKRFLACSPFWGQTPTALSNSFVSIDHSAQALSPNSLLSFLVKGLPFPLLYYSLKNIMSTKNVVKLCLLGIVFFTMFENHRILHLMPLLLLPELQEKELNRGWFKVLIVLLVLFQVQQFVNFNLTCF